MNHFCIDIDNVVARTDEVMRRLVSEFSHGRVRLAYKDIVKFNYHECCGRTGNQITKDDWNRVHDIFSISTNILSVMPMKGAVECLRLLAEKGRVHLATSRLSKARKATIEWLEHYQFPKHDLHFLHHGEKHSSLRVFTAAVEDDYDQAKSFAQAGTPCFIMRHPWNEKQKKTKDLRWVENWSELAEQLLKLM
jgi:uncharacterized HAD superfamily protein